MTAALYTTDFYAWIQRQADLLKNEEYHDLDRNNLIEELEAMARSERRQLVNRLRVLLTHLLKLLNEPDGDPAREWQETVREQRRHLELLLEDSPSLRRDLPDAIVYAYERARQDAAQGLNVDLMQIVATCPWTVEKILDLKWLP
jgi:hypothetical protein